MTDHHRNAARHTWPAWGLLAAQIAVLVAGCAAPADDDDDDDDQAIDGQMTDANNFTLSSTLSVELVAAEELADLTICWDQLTADIFGLAVDVQSDVEGLTLLLFPSMDPAEITDALVADSILQQDIGGYFVCEPDDGATCCQLSAFGLGGSTPGVDQYFEADRGTWMVAVDGGERGYLAFLFLIADPDSSITEVCFIDASSTLALDVDLTSLTPVRVPADGDVTFDWSGLTSDGQGNELALYKLDGLMIGRYEGLGAADLEERLPQLESIAAELWQLDVSGLTETSALDLVSADGTTQEFGGFSADGTWLAALRCSNCVNPTPKFITILDVRP
jgi:hypothetical protein